MKTKMILALLTSFVLLGGTAFAFHGGGVAHCDGCHSMHNSADNPREGSATAASLMKGSDASSTCLNCHDGSARYHVSSAIGDNINQGGDFFWVSDLAVHNYMQRGRLVTFEPDNKGHNVIAFDFGLTQDATLGVAPGGVYPSNTLGCTSCHDPHGQVNGGTATGTAAISASGSYGTAAPVDGSILGNYRLLDDTLGATPVARANSYDGKFVDYGQGMSGWCAGCHLNFDSATNMHPTNVAVPVSYNSYVASGDFTGDLATAKDTLVPFERGVDDGFLLDETSTAGVSAGTEQVMCLSCHRAHASAFDNALRWDNSHEFIVDSSILHEATTTLIANGALPYYGDGNTQTDPLFEADGTTPVDEDGDGVQDTVTYNVGIDVEAKYGAYQRQLCNKCHAKD